MGVAVVGAAVTFARAWPWMATPDPARVANAWDTVERAAVTPPAPIWDEATYSAFLRAMRSASSTLSKIDVRDANARSEETLPADVDESLERLVAWANASKDAPGRTLPWSACSAEPRDAVTITQLANVVFRSRPSDARVDAFVRLSVHLRRTGRVIEHRVGMRILELALRSVAPDAKASSIFRQHRADVAEQRGAVARDALCIDDMFAHGADGIERVDVQQAPKAPWLARRFARPARERAMLRIQAGERLAECAAAGDGDDGRGFVECWRRAVERDDVPSVMSRAVAVIPPPIDDVLALQRSVLDR